MPTWLMSSKLVHVVQSPHHKLQWVKLEVKQVAVLIEIDSKISMMSTVGITSRQFQREWAVFLALIQRLTNGRLWINFKHWECTKRWNKRRRLRKIESKSSAKSSWNNSKNSLQERRFSSRTDSTMQEHVRKEAEEKKLLIKPELKRKQRRLKRSRNGATHMRLLARQKKNMTKKLHWITEWSWLRKM